MTPRAGMLARHPPEAHASPPTPRPTAPEPRWIQAGGGVGPSNTKFGEPVNKVNIEERYKAAIETHKHYDTISISCIAGIVGVLPACLLILEKVPSHYPKQILFVAGLLISSVLYRLYYLSAHAANLARNVAREINASGTGEISTVLYKCHFGEKESITEMRKTYWPKKGPIYKFNMYGLVFWLYLISFIGSVYCIFNAIY